MKKHCYCTQVESDGHDYACRNHPRFNRSKITDKMRLDWFNNQVYRSLGCAIIGRHTVTQEDPEMKGQVRIDTGATVRQAIDAAIRAGERNK